MINSNIRPDDMSRITTRELADAFISEQVALIQRQVGDKKVLLALSGGVDSSVVAALLIKAIGRQLVCVHANHGLMRKGESVKIECTNCGADGKIECPATTPCSCTDGETACSVCNSTGRIDCPECEKFSD